jgi:hypothetical protein
MNGAYNTDVSAVSSLSICSFPNSGGASGTTTITGAITSTSTNIYMIFEEWAVGIAATPLDQTQKNNGAAATTGNSGTTPTLSQSNELIVSALITNANSGTSTPTIQAPFTPSPASPVVNGSTWGLAAGNQQVVSTGGQIATFNWTNSVAWRSVIATYKLTSTGDTLLGQAWI